MKAYLTFSHLGFLCGIMKKSQKRNTVFLEMLVVVQAPRPRIVLHSWTLTSNDLPELSDIDSKFVYYVFRLAGKPILFMLHTKNEV